MRLLLLVFVTVSLTAGAFSPRTDWPCSPEMTKRAADADADVATALGVPVSGVCTCPQEACPSAKVDQTVTLPNVGRLALHLKLTLFVGEQPAPGPQVPAVDTLSAVGTRIAAHPPLAALLKDSDGTCALRLNGAAPRFDFNFECRVGAWTLSIAELPVPQSENARQIVRSQYRLPLSVVDADPDVKVARKHPAVVRFLQGKKDITVQYVPYPAQRVVLMVDAAAESRGTFRVKEALTVFFVTSDRGGEAETKGVKAVCKGEQFYRCP